MYCSQRHVLRHGWHFPSWPKVLSAHCPLAGLSGGITGRCWYWLLQQGSNEARRVAAKLRLAVPGLAPRDWIRQTWSSQSLA